MHVLKTLAGDLLRYRSMVSVDHVPDAEGWIVSHHDDSEMRGGTKIQRNLADRYVPIDDGSFSRMACRSKRSRNLASTARRVYKTPPNKG